MNHVEWAGGGRRNIFLILIINNKARQPEKFNKEQVHNEKQTNNICSGFLPAR